jgi:hypothetical protein
MFRYAHTIIAYKIHLVMWLPWEPLEWKVSSFPWNECIFPEFTPGRRTERDGEINGGHDHFSVPLAFSKRGEIVSTREVSPREQQRQWGNDNKMMLETKNTYSSNSQKSPEYPRVHLKGQEPAERSWKSCHFENWRKCGSTLHLWADEGWAPHSCFEAIDFYEDAWL